MAVGFSYVYITGLKINRHEQSIDVRVPRVCVSFILRMSITDNNHKRDWILESANSYKYKLTDLPFVEPECSLHEHMASKLPPTLVTAQIL